jgi:amino acid permease
MDFISYIKDRLGYILIYLISNIVTIIVMKLDNIISGNVNNDNILYTVLLFSFFLISFLLFDYSKKKKVYSLLNSMEHSDGNLQDAFKTSCKSDIEHNYFIKILKDSYRNYEYKLSEYREKQKEEINETGFFIK